MNEKECCWIWKKDSLKKHSENVYQIDERIDSQRDVRYSNKLMRYMTEIFCLEEIANKDMIVCPAAETAEFFSTRG